MKTSLALPSVVQNKIVRPAALIFEIEAGLKAELQEDIGDSFDFCCRFWQATLILAWFASAPSQLCTGHN